MGRLVVVAPGGLVITVLVALVIVVLGASGQGAGGGGDRRRCGSGGAGGSLRHWGCDENTLMMQAGHNWTDSRAQSGTLLWYSASLKLIKCMECALLMCEASKAGLVERECEHFGTLDTPTLVEV